MAVSRRSSGNADQNTASIKQLLTSNYGSRIWSVAVLWLSTPILLRLLGAESYGIVALYNVLYNAVTLMDMGLSAAANRELALLSATGPAGEMRDLVRTFEVLFAGLSISVAMGLYFGAPWMAEHWVHHGGMSLDGVISSLRYMSVAVVFQFTGTLYFGGLQGLRRHVIMNALLVAAITIRQAGAIAIMQFRPATSLLYFQWQALVNASWLLAMSLALWRSLPVSNRAARFEGRLLRGVWKYAAGLTGISLSGLLLTQMDKFLLVKLLPLDAFAHYSIAGNLATGPAVASNPVKSAVFPQFVRLAGERREAQLVELYHKSSQLVSVLVLPAVTVFLFFARQICQLWIGPEGLLVYRSARLLVLGAAIMALTIIPYAIQLARGNTRISFTANIAALLVSVPALFALTARFGATGAAFVAVLLGTISMTVQFYLMWTRCILPGKELWKWFFNDIFLPLLTSMTVVMALRTVFVASERRIVIVAAMGTAWIAATFVAGLATRHIRRWCTTQAGGVFRFSLRTRRLKLNRSSANE